ncbi:murein DD-endopeptidase MepM/ murein hydrolase activator NlpD [Streptomyces pseudovenezuelae]|uniref:M23 family metallopeptidase n=1 Tax=unclassified Streptomyces TaxID=2593676 RepID=UPI0024767886|nr:MULTISPECIES: M23 family metallopeptidase [unclassified Streptomyces]MDH6518061.1 murein DD-endopeptidase MepM/ murein hydrolase activator NlpD [Streptomyces sp. SAI-090]MDH6550288.1 murein DD-endopeptidase MepM/ murein hydrolase activator NlpD [Streptomyces sp. SAI-041]MDH6569340.1 murein DD-endopeptidase MepM/ murein hydrolase activator NlpD [Streptomyces sp. SAI-117]MDH6617848.1 murein DD-endopeptidase MepM/ murein hydrolase activator NlpD [Streptomyces sp. SAI-135]
MASNPPAPEAPYVPSDTLVYGGYRADDEAPLGEWNPTADSLAPVRGRHRVAKQRGGGFARSSTVLGVGVIAAVSAGGMASANTGKPPVSISMPDLPNVGSLISDDADTAADDTSAFSSVGATTADTAEGTSDAGEALRSRILAQAEVQQDQLDTKAAQAVADAAQKEADAAAAKAEKEAQEKAAAAKKAAEEEAAKKAEAERLAELAKQYTLPTSSYTITSTFGQAGSLWSSGYHTGLDFAAPTGTLIKAVHSGTITEAGWAGSYGYRTILTLDDGTELWFCHQSSISVSVGQKVATGDVIGRVGATGNVTGAHLHLEVHPGGSADGIDPMAWLRGKGLNP